MLARLDASPSAPLMTVDEVATELQCNRSKAYEYLRDNIIPNQRNGSAFVIRRAVFNRWLAGDYVDNSQQLASALETLTRLFAGGFKITITPEQ